jgi:hypothetical protein
MRRDRASTGSCESTGPASFRREIGARVDLSGVAGNFWVGLALLHARLHEQHQELGDDELYDKARLVNAALMAKIHTVDWTPAIIAHTTTVLALRTNWWGCWERASTSGSAAAPAAS